MSAKYQFTLVRFLLGLIEDDLTRKEEEIAETLLNLQWRETITMSVITTNDNAVRLRPSAQDRDGVAIFRVRLQMTVDRPDVASITADPDVPGAFVINALPASDPSIGSRTVIVTTADSENGVSTTTTIEFDPGIEQTISVAAEVIGLSPSAEGTGGTGDQSTGDQGDAEETTQTNPDQTTVDPTGQVQLGGDPSGQGNDPNSVLARAGAVDGNASVPGGPAAGQGATGINNEAADQQAAVSANGDAQADPSSTTAPVAP